MGDLLSDFALIDPVEFAEKALTIDGQPFQITSCGRDYLHEIYRYICLEAVGKKGKSVVVKKGRQVEMTTTACSVSLYFACGGVYDHIRGLHTFPQIEQARRYSKVVFSPRVIESVNSCIAKLLENDGIAATVINARFIKPLDKELIIQSVKSADSIVTVEEGTLCGGFGSAVLELLAEEGINKPVLRIGLPDEFIEHGKRDEMLEKYGLTGKGVYQRILTRLTAGI